MKAYTDISQSKKLAEILPHNTADNTWERVTIAGSYFNIPEEQQYVHNGNIPFTYFSGIGIPCWSLAALLEMIPEPILTYIDKDNWNISTFEDNHFKEEIISSNPVDACYEMILKLHEQKLL